MKWGTWGLAERTGGLKLSFGGEEIALMDEARSRLGIGFRFRFGFEDEARAHGFEPDGERWCGGGGGDGSRCCGAGGGGMGEEVGEGTEFVAEGGDLVALLGVVADGCAHVDGGLGVCFLWVSRSVDGLWSGVGGVFGFGLGLEDLAGAGDGVALVVEEALDVEGHLDVALAVEALAGASLVGLELGEFSLPEAQNIGRNIAEAGYVADAEVELVRDGNRLGWYVLANWMMRYHVILKYRTANGD